MSAQEKEQKEAFVSRWSRRKLEARERSLQEAGAAMPQEPAKPADAKPLPDLPPVDELSFESDFRDFMDTRVDDAVRRIALKKLFSDPRFNITDGLDDYAEDYAALEDLSAAVVEKLQHARRTLRRQEPEEGETPAMQPAADQHIEQQVAEQHLEQRPAEPAQEPQQLEDAASLEDEHAQKDVSRNS